MQREKRDDLTSVLVIAIASLAIAAVTFGVLDSQAGGEHLGVSIGGALAGVIVTVLVLATLFRQLRSSSDEMKSLREENKRLEQKLIRGAPRPSDFETEVGEKQRIVVSRPKSWAVQGGVLFAMQLGESHADDIYPAKFRASYEPITRNTTDAAVYYKWLRQNAERASGPSMEAQPRTEFVSVGGTHPNGWPSLKLVVPEYYEVRESPDKVTGHPVYSYSRISRERFEELREDGTELASNSATSSANGNGSSPPTTLPPDEAQEVKLIRVQRMSVVCHNSELDTIFWLEFWDDVEDFLESSNDFNQVVSSVRFLG